MESAGANQLYYQLWYREVPHSLTYQSLRHHTRSPRVSAQ